MYGIIWPTVLYLIEWCATRPLRAHQYIEAYVSALIENYRLLPYVKSYGSVRTATSSMQTFMQRQAPTAPLILIRGFL